MQAIVAVPNSTTGTLPGQILEGAKTLADTTSKRIHNLWPKQMQAPGGNESTWESTKVRFMHTIELLPDTTTILDALRAIAFDYGMQPPVVLRVAYTASATLCTVLIPGVLANLFGLISVALPRGMHKGPQVHHSVGITYLATVAATLIAVGADGVRDICDALRLPSKGLEKIVEAILPWIPYILRISMLVQIIDIVGGAAFQRDLKERVGAPLKSSWNQLQAQKALDVLSEHRYYAKRANGGASGMKYTLLKLQKEVNSWNPVRSRLAVRKTQRLAVSLNERSVYYVRNQVFGFGGNLFALLSLVMTHIVGAATLSIFSASYYWTQTTHGWDSPPQASLQLNPKKTGDQFSLWRTLTSGVDFGKWAVGQVIG